ncbi:ribosomal-processing cysteine protease Prp [Lachnospiraceae bacterium 62-35]
MIQVTVFRDSHNLCRGIELEGHANFGESGTDIICAAVSALAVNTVNSIEAFTDDAFTGETGETDGYLSFHLTGDISGESKLLMEALILGLQNIREAYGAEYINIRSKEV